MASDDARVRFTDSHRFALGVTLRAVVTGVLAYGAVQMVLLQRYGSALVLVSLAGLVAIDLARHADKADRILSRFVSALAAGELELPTPKEGGLSGLTRLNLAMRDFQLDLARTRHRQQAEIDYLNTLIDTVSAGLLTVASGGKVACLNRAAQRLATQGALGDDILGELKVLAPGQRRVMRLAHGRRVLAAAVKFTASGQTKVLVSLQNIENELDAAEIKAWQDLARILAHEMMNSLTPIASLAQSVRRLLTAGTGSTTTDALEAVDIIGQRSLGLMGFVERYRQVADLPRPSLRNVTLADTFVALEGLLKPELSDRGIAYSRSMEPETLLLEADPQLLEQALINIMRNAIDAVAGVEQPAIDVVCERDEDRISISIRDNGKGVWPEDLDRIFVPFFTTKAGGSGIGLSLARQVMMAHGGQIEARPNPEGGMLFRLTLQSD